MGSTNTSGLTNTANQLGTEQSSLFNQVLGLLGQMGGGAGNLTSLYGPLSSIFQSALGGAGQMAPGELQQFMQLAANPQALAQFTGINAPGLTKQATGYLSDPNATNFAQGLPGWLQGTGPGASALNVAGPQAESFYRNEMTQGLNPQFAQNAQNQLTQQFGAASDTLAANAAPGTNVGAQQLNLTNQLLGSSANLGGQLAGESQQIAGQGAQGLVGTAQGMDVNNLQRIMSQANLASMSDAQKMQMLTGGAQLGNAYNQQALGNVGQGASSGFNMLNQAQNLANVGTGIQEFSAGEMGNMGTTLGNEGFQYTDLAAQLQAMQPNPFSLVSQLVGGGASDYSSIMTGMNAAGKTGGAAGPAGGAAAAGSAAGKGAGAGATPEMAGKAATAGM